MSGTEPNLNVINLGLIHIARGFNPTHTTLKLDSVLKDETQISLVLANFSQYLGLTYAMWKFLVTLLTRALCAIMHFWHFSVTLINNNLVNSSKIPYENLMYNLNIWIE